MSNSERNIEHEELWTPKEAADYLRVKEGTVKQWVKFNKIPYEKAGSLTRFRKSRLDAWLTDNVSEKVPA